MNTAKAVRLIQSALTPDLLKGRWKQQTHPLSGYCYVASEALWHLLGKTDWKPVCATYTDKGGRATHWWLVNKKTGKVVWRVNPEWDETLVVDGKTTTQHLGTYRGTLLAVDGHFLCLGELGHLLWLDLSPQGYKELARTWLFAARETWSLPVLSRGLLYISQHTREIRNRKGSRLICYDLRAEK